MAASTGEIYQQEQVIPGILNGPVAAAATVYSGSAVCFNAAGYLEMIEDYTGNYVSVANPTSAPSVNPTGGGSTGGLLAAGTYKACYTYTDGTNETKRSPFSAAFVVAAGNQPKLTLPTFPSNVTKYNVYVTNNAGDVGSEELYASNQTAATYTLAVAEPGGVAPPDSNSMAVKFAGICETTINNSGGNNGDQVAKFSSVFNGYLGSITFDAVNPTQAWVGRKCYFTDDHTVALNSPNYIAAGYVQSVDTTGSTGRVTVDTTAVLAIEQPSA